MDHHSIDWYWAIRGFAAGLAVWAAWVATNTFFTDYDEPHDVFDADGDYGDRYRVPGCRDCERGSRLPHIAIVRRPRGW